MLILPIRNLDSEPERFLLVLPRGAQPSIACSRTNPLFLSTVRSSTHTIFYNPGFCAGRAGRNPSSVRGSHPSYRSTRAFGRKLTGAYVYFHGITTAASFHPVNP